MKLHSIQSALVLGCVLLSCGCHGTADVDEARIVNADKEPQNWLSVGRNYAEDRFSPLASINEQNVGRLGLAWFVDLDTKIGSEVTPLVVDGVMYTVGAWNVIYALDAKSGKELWRYDPEAAPRLVALHVLRSGVRGLAVWKGQVIAATHRRATDRARCAERKAGCGMYAPPKANQPYSITGAPRVFTGKVIIGNAGGEFGVRGYVTAYDAETGKQIWRFYTVPGDPAKGFENDAMEMAAKSWNGEWWKSGGGGTVWDAFTYDPELNLFYIGTGNGSPWIAEICAAPAAATICSCARSWRCDADTGEYVWHYQDDPGENWDYDCDATNDAGRTRRSTAETHKVLMQAPKNGFFYVIDRENGKLLSASPFVHTTWASQVDMTTGRPVEIKENLYSDTEAKMVSPTPFGAHNWHPMSYDPLTHLVYFSAQEAGWAYSRTATFDYHPMAWNLALNPQAKQPPASAAVPVKGFTLAWDPVANREAWRIPHDGPWNGGVLTRPAICWWREPRTAISAFTGRAMAKNSGPCPSAPEPWRVP